jgi:cell division protein FtsB
MPQNLPEGFKEKPLSEEIAGPPWRQMTGLERTALICTAIYALVIYKWLEPDTDFYKLRYWGTGLAGVGVASTMAFIGLKLTKSRFAEFVLFIGALAASTPLLLKLNEQLVPSNVAAIHDAAEAVLIPIDQANRRVAKAVSLFARQPLSTMDEIKKAREALVAAKAANEEVENLLQRPLTAFERALSTHTHVHGEVAARAAQNFDARIVSYLSLLRIAAGTTQKLILGLTQSVDLEQAEMERSKEAAEIQKSRAELEAQMKDLTGQLSLNKAEILKEQDRLKKGN